MTLNTIHHYSKDTADTHIQGERGGEKDDGGNTEMEEEEEGEEIKLGEAKSKTEKSRRSTPQQNQGETTRGRRTVMRRRGEAMDGWIDEGRRRKRTQHPSSPPSNEHRNLNSSLCFHFSSLSSAGSSSSSSQQQQSLDMVNRRRPGAPRSLL